MTGVPNRSSVNWLHWRHKPKVEVWEACALSLGIEPIGMHGPDSDWKVGPGKGPYHPTNERVLRDFRLMLAERVDLLASHVRAKNPQLVLPGADVFYTTTYEVTLPSFVKWAEGKLDRPNPPIHPELVRIATEIAADAASELPAEPEGSGVEGLSTSGGKPFARRRFYQNEILRVVLDLGHDPREKTNKEVGTRTVKDDARKKLTGLSGWTDKVFDTAWQELRDKGFFGGTKK